MLYELGSIRTVPDNYNIKEVYESMSNSIPVVFVLPSDRQDSQASEGTKGRAAGYVHIWLKVPVNRS